MTSGGIADIGVIAPPVLVAGVGNIFFGDDGFGPETAKRLAAANLPEWVTVADYGISGMHLAYDLVNTYRTAILIDAVPRGGAPGTVYLIEPQPESHAGTTQGGSLAGAALFDGHGMQPDVVLSVLGMLGEQAGRLLIVGCEPACDEPGMELSEPAAAAVDQAVRLVLSLITAAEPGLSREGGSHVPRHTG